MSDIDVILCYDHNSKDEPLVDELKVRLKNLKRYGFINAFWDDREGVPGREWNREIDEHLDSAQIILLLISSDFLASDRCYSNMERAMIRHEREEAVVMAVMLRPMEEEEVLFSKLQVLPSNGKPVTRWSNRDEAWKNVMKGIKSRAESMAQNVEDFLPDSLSSEYTMISDIVVPESQSSQFVAEKPPGNLPVTREYSTVPALNPPKFDFTLKRTLIAHLGPVATVSFSPDGEHLVSDSEDKQIKIWDRFATQPILSFPSQAESVYSVVFSPDNRWLASGSDDGTINIWDAQNGRLFKPLKSHEEPIASVAYGPGMKVMSGSDDGVIKIWNVPGEALERELKDHKRAVTSIALSTDGHILASGSYDTTVKIWNTSTGKVIKTLPGHTKAVSSVALSVDGKLLVSGSHDTTVKIWDISRGVALRTLPGHTKAVTSVALSADGKLLVSGSHDTTVKIWDVATGEMLRELTGHTEAVLSVAFHPNGQIIASGSYDKTIGIYEMSSVPTQDSWDPDPNPPQAPVTTAPSGKGPFLDGGMPGSMPNLSGTWSLSSKSPFLDGRIPGSTSSDQDGFKQKIRIFLKPRSYYTGSPLFILGIIANILGPICIGLWLGRAVPSFGNETAWFWSIVSFIGLEGAWWLFNYSGREAVKGCLSPVLAIIWGFVGKAFATLIGTGASISFLPDANVMFVIFLIVSLILHLRLTFTRA